MTLRKKLGSGIERLELRAAPSTLLGTGLASKFEAYSLGAKDIDSGFVAKPKPGQGSKSNEQAPPELAAKPQSALDALFAARSVARKGLSEGGGLNPNARSVDIDESPVATFPSGTPVIEGASSLLRRTPNGVSWTLKTNELQAGHAYTLWVVVFNNPDECVGGCGLDDLQTAGVETTLAYGGGHVVGPSGKATFSGHLQEGDTSGFPLDSPFVGLPGQDLGLVDASQADIHLVIRDHGEVIPGSVAEQIGSFTGGCSMMNPCANVQVAVHQP